MMLLRTCDKGHYDRGPHVGVTVGGEEIVYRCDGPQPVEVDYEAAAKVLHGIDHRLFDEANCVINDTPYLGDAKAIVDEALADR